MSRYASIHIKILTYLINYVDSFTPQSKMFRPLEPSTACIIPFTACTSFTFNLVLILLIFYVCLFFCSVCVMHGCLAATSDQSRARTRGRESYESISSPAQIPSCHDARTPQMLHKEPKTESVGHC